MHDDMQGMRVNEMVKCFKDFQIPCRWVPSIGYNYGYPQFNYYGPLSYYVMSFFNLLGVGVFDSVKIGFYSLAYFGKHCHVFSWEKTLGEMGRLTFGFDLRLCSIQSI